MRKYLIITLLILITIAVGFIRDAVFIPINASIKEGADTGILKWVLTLLFTAIYLIITLLFLWILYRSVKYILIAISVYLLILVVSLLILTVGYFFSSFQAVYPLVRAIMGIAQSPVIIMVLIAIGYMGKFDK